MWDPVPWVIGGGAEHSPEVARTLAYAATGGAEGVGGSADLRVVPLATPGTSVRALPGTALILNRSGLQETYAARMGSEDVVAVAAQGSSGTRYDLVVARVEDPFANGTPWQDPADAKVGPYVFTRIIPNVGASVIASNAAAVAYLKAANYSAIPLAGITIPASTATITSGMITDLRAVARPKRTRDLYNTQPTATTSASSTTTIDWCPQANRSIVVPTWATQMKVVGTVAGAVCRNAAITGNLSFLFGSLSGQGVAVDMDVNTRQTLMTSDTLAIPANLRGTSQVLKMRANRSGGTGLLQTDAYSTVLWDVEFLEVASAD